MVSKSYQSEQKRIKLRLSSPSYQSQKRLRLSSPAYQSQKRLRLSSPSYQPQTKPRLNIVGISAYPKKKKIAYAYPKKIEKELTQKEINKQRQKEIKKLLKELSQYEKELIKEQVIKKESDYSIIKQFDSDKEKLIRKEIKKAKNKEKKDKLKDVNKITKCKFNYITQHHIGYKFEHKCNYSIYEGIPINEIDDIINDIRSILTILNNKVLCYQRVNYCSLEYNMILSSGDIEQSKKSTNINSEYGLTSFKNMLSQIEDVIYYLYDLVHQSQSPKQIDIYNIIYVNYDFKSNIMR